MQIEQPTVTIYVQLLSCHIASHVMDVLVSYIDALNHRFDMIMSHSLIDHATRTQFICAHMVQEFYNTVLFIFLITAVILCITMPDCSLTIIFSSLKNVHISIDWSAVWWYFSGVMVALRMVSCQTDLAMRLLTWVSLFLVLRLNSPLPPHFFMSWSIGVQRAVRTPDVMGALLRGAKRKLLEGTW